MERNIDFNSHLDIKATEQSWQTSSFLLPALFLPIFPDLSHCPNLLYPQIHVFLIPNIFFFTFSIAINTRESEMLARNCQVVARGTAGRRTWWGQHRVGRILVAFCGYDTWPFPKAIYRRKSFRLWIQVYKAGEAMQKGQILKLRDYVWIRKANR